MYIKKKYQDRYENDKHQTGESDYLCEVIGTLATLVILFLVIFSYIFSRTRYFRIKNNNNVIYTTILIPETVSDRGPISMTWAAHSHTFFFLSVKCRKLGYMLIIVVICWSERGDIVVLSPNRYQRNRENMVFKKKKSVGQKQLRDILTD